MSAAGVEPGAGYRAAREGVALFDRTDLRYWRFTGRDPAKMLEGVVSGRMPTRPEPFGAGAAGVFAGEATLHTVLTPKGRMVSDLRLAREAGDEGEPDVLWAIVPAAGADGLRAHLKRYLPPRFAKLEEPDDVAILGVCGAEADAAVVRAVEALHGAAADDLAVLPAGGTLSVPTPDGDVLRLIRGAETVLPAYQVIGAPSAVARVAEALEARGAVHGTAAEWNVVRVEEGTPAYGVDMDEGTIPTEAGLEVVAIDHAKGCYTGQEVIVRIRDRGHVNRKLLQVRLGEAEPPVSGTELFVEGREKPAGEVRSAVRSPRFGETIALAYVRREVWTGEGDQPDFRTGA